MNILKLFLVFALGINFLSTSTYGKDIVVKIGAYELPPHMYLKNDGKTIGGHLHQYVEKELFSPLGMKADWSFHPFSRLMLEVEKGSVHVVCILAKNNEREVFLAYPKAVLFKTYSVLIFRKNDAPKDPSMQNIKGKLIGHTQGSIVPDYLTKKGVKFEFLAGDNSLERNLEKLKRKRLDGVFAPTQSHAEHVLKKSGMDKDFVVVPISESELDLYIAVSRKIDPEIREKILKRLEILDNRYSQEFTRINFTLKQISSN